jgi:hypothetical protein
LRDNRVGNGLTGQPTPIWAGDQKPIGYPQQLADFVLDGDMESGEGSSQPLAAQAEQHVLNERIDGSAAAQRVRVNSRDGGSDGLLVRQYQQRCRAPGR